MQKVFNVAVDIGRKLPAPAFEVNTNDLKSVKLLITITNGQTLLDLTDTTVRIAIRKPDNNILFQDCTVKDAKIGQVEIVLENQAYIMAGTHTAEIMCYKGSEVVAVSGTFSYKSTKGIMNDEAVESRSEFTTITGMLKDVQDTIEDFRENGTGIDTKARQDIQSVTTQLAETKNQFVEILNNIDDKYVAGSRVERSYIKELNAKNYASFFRKMSWNSIATTIECNGDSMTWGLENGKQSLTTYPQALQNAMRQQYSLVSVVNNGRSGDTAQTGYLRTLESQNADLTLIMYGINDANASVMPDVFMKYIEQLTVRRILQGSAVILLTSTKTEGSSFTAGHMMFGEFTRLVANLYDIPIINTRELMGNYNGSIFSDDTHYNEKGYTTLGYRIAAALYGNIYHPKYVNHGDTLLTRTQLDGIFHRNIPAITHVTAINGVVPETRAELTTGAGKQLKIDPITSVHYAFYTTQDNLYILPNMELQTGSRVRLELNFSINQHDQSVDDIVFQEPNSGIAFPASRTISDTNFWVKNITKRVALENADTLGVLVPRKGWHILRVTSDGTAPFFLRGITFAQFDYVNSYNRWRHAGLYKRVVPSKTESINIPLDTLLNIFDFKYKDVLSDSTLDIPLKVTIYNNYQSIIEYAVVLGAGNTPISITEIRRINIATTPDQKTLSSIEINRTTNLLTFFFTNSTSTSCNCIIQPL